MKRIHIYEAEPGDYRFDEDYEHYGGYYTEIDDVILLYLQRLDRMRKELNETLASLKKDEIDPWDEEAPVK